MSRADRFFFGAGVFLLPFIFALEGEQIRVPKAQFLIILAGLYVSWKLIEKVSVALGCAAATMFIYGWLHSYSFPAQDLAVLGSAFASCLLLRKAREDDIKHCLKLLEYAGALCAAYALFLQVPNIDPLFTFPDTVIHTRCIAFFGQQTLYGPFAVACFASALFGGRWLLAAFLFAPVIFIDASFTYLSAGVVIAMYAIYRLRRPAILGLALMAAITVTFLCTYTPNGKPQVVKNFLSDNGRSSLWTMTYRIAKVRPLLGHGFNSFSYQFLIFQDKEMRQRYGIVDEKMSKEAQEMFAWAEFLKKSSGKFRSAHNEYLQVFYDYGLLGVFLMAWVIASFALFWFWIPDTAQNWALAAIFLEFLANAFGSFPFHLIPQALIPLMAFAAVTMQVEGSTISICLRLYRQMKSYFALAKSPMMWLRFMASRLVRVWRVLAEHSIGP